MINKKYLLLVLCIMTIALLIGYLIESIHFKFYLFSSIALSTITFLFYISSRFSLRFQKDAFFVFVVATAFFIKILLTIIFFAWIKNQYFFSKLWAAHYFVLYVVLSFIASLFISNKPTNEFK